MASSSGRLFLQDIARVLQGGLLVAGAAAKNSGIANRVAASQVLSLQHAQQQWVDTCMDSARAAASPNADSVEDSDHDAAHVVSSNGGVAPAAQSSTTDAPSNDTRPLASTAAAAHAQQHVYTPTASIHNPVQQSAVLPANTAVNASVNVVAVNHNNTNASVTHAHTAPPDDMPIIDDVSNNNTSYSETTASSPSSSRKRREAHVPASPLGRVLGFAGLGASLLYGSVKGQVGAMFRGTPSAPPTPNSPYPSSVVLSEENATRLADALCRLRGAALKIGQMLSMQDENILPPQLQAALERVRAGADIMPRAQLDAAMSTALGPHWRALLADFDEDPMAAASIGQVHCGVLHDGRRVAIKVQYPGVARSIESDVDNLLRLVRVANVLPKGLYVEAAAAVAKKELALECDYEYEAQCQSRFKQLIENDPRVSQYIGVPGVVEELSSSSVITTELVPGVHIDKCTHLPQHIRDAIGTRLLDLTLKELFTWRFMQTDPNWGNFLYSEQNDKLYLIDFGAAREYPRGFVDDYLRMVHACAERDGPEVIHRSVRLGFLTGDEGEVMLEAHTQAGFAVGTPFGTEGLYDFGAHGGLTQRITALGTIMLKHRLKPPPEEAYSLHRKLSGAFLACIKLGARVPARALLLETYDSHEFADDQQC